MSQRRNIVAFIQWLKSQETTDTSRDGLKAKIKDNLYKFNVSKSEKNKIEHSKNK
jgi:hypothetical protein